MSVDPWFPKTYNGGHLLAKIPTPETCHHRVGFGVVDSEDAICQDL